MDLKEFGRQLKEERLRQGLELTEVMEKTKISRVSLEAIEEGNERSLPHPVYAKGFVKNYARFLGLDADKMGNTMAQIYISDDDPVSDEQLVLTDARKLPAVKSGFSARFLLLVAVLFLILAGACVWIFWSPLQQALFPASEQESPLMQLPSDVGRISPGTGVEHGPTRQVFEERPSTDDVSSPLAGPVPAFPAAPLQAPLSGGDDADLESPLESGRSASPADPPRQDLAPPPAPDVLDGRPAALESPAVEPPAPSASAADERTLEIRAFQNCWLSIQADGGRVREVFLRPNERLVASFNTVMELKLGNAGGVELFLDGRPWPLQARAGEVLVLRFP